MKQPFLVWFPGTANQSCASSKEPRTSCSFVSSVYLHPNCLSHSSSAGDLCAVNIHAAHQRTGNPNIHQPDLHLYQYVLFFAPLKSLLSFSAQVQNLALRGQQGALTSSLSQSQLQSLSVKQCPGASAQLSVTNQPVARLKSPGAELNSQGAAAKSSPAETSSETVGKNYKISDLTTRELNMCPNVSSVAGHPLISTGKPSLSGCCLHMQMQWKCSVSIVLQMEEWKQQEKLKCEGHLALSIKRGVGLLWQRSWGAHRAAVFHDNTPAMCVCGWWDSFSLWIFQCFFTCIWIMHCIASCFSVIHKLNGKHPGNFCQDRFFWYFFLSVQCKHICLHTHIHTLSIEKNAGSKHLKLKAVNLIKNASWKPLCSDLFKSFFAHKNMSCVNGS